jgi:hypothetical protein
MTPGPMCVLAACLQSISKMSMYSISTSSGTRSAASYGRAYACKKLMDIFLESSTLWYIICRVFIIVESFIMLAHVPDLALQVPTWSAYIPHIV